MLAGVFHGLALIGFPSRILSASFFMCFFAREGSVRFPPRNRPHGRSERTQTLGDVGVGLRQVRCWYCAGGELLLNRLCSSTVPLPDRYDTDTALVSSRLSTGAALVLRWCCTCTVLVLCYVASYWYSTCSVVVLHFTCTGLELNKYSAGSVLARCVCCTDIGLALYRYCPGAF